MTLIDHPTAHDPLEVSGRAPATVTMASPSWWGADSTRYRGERRGEAVFVKEYTPSAQAYIDTAAAVAAATAAGDAGIGPRVIAASPGSGTAAFADLSDSHRTAGLGDFTAPDAAAGLFRIRSAAAALAPAVAREATVFDDIRALRAALIRSGAALPGDAAFLLRIVDDAESRIAAAGVDREFRHGDGNVSNVLLARDNAAPLLVDWDWAGFMDPFQDIGVVLAELADDEDHAAALFEAATGRMDRSLFARSLVYGYADHVRQALIGALVNELDPGTFEYSKFSDWQFLRARVALQSIRTDDLLRRISA